MKRYISIMLVVLMLNSMCLLSFSATAAELDPTAMSSGENSDTETITVPQIYITTADGNGTLLQKEDDYVEASITIKDTDSSVITDNIQFKVRGNSTAAPSVTKKAFTFKFESKKNVLNMGKAKKWALLANAFDPTLMRNYIAFDFAQKMELDFTSQQRFVELWLDGSYRGCYVLTEPVEEGSTRVDIDIDSNNGMKDFLIELEADRVEEEVSYFSAGEMRFAVKEPEEPNDEQLAYISSTMNDILNIIKKGDQEEISKKIDIQSFTRYYLLNELVKTLDFGYSSVFFYYKDDILYCGPVWDYDLAAGNVTSSYSEASKSAADPNGLYAAYRNFYRHLTAYSWFVSEIRATCVQYYDYIYNITAKGGLMDTLIDTYGDVFDRNYNEAGWSPSTQWSTLQMTPFATFSENVEFLREWIYNRGVWLRNHYDLYRTAGLCGDSNSDRTISIMDATLIQMHLAEIMKLDGKGLLCGDSDRNGALTIVDATRIQLFLVHKIQNL